jgi:hypothetical protein
MRTFEQQMAHEDAIIRREELCVQFGFRNRFTAKVYEWAHEAGISFDEDCPLDDAADVVRDFAIGRGVPEERLDGVDFVAIGLALQAG